MNDLDEVLCRWRDAPVDPRIAGIDAAVLHGLAARRERIAALRSMAVVGVMALGLGLSAGLFSGGPVQAAAPAAPFGSAPSLAPSRLLMGE